MHGQASTTAYQLPHLLGEGAAERYLRIDGPLLVGRDDMDDASPANLEALTAHARGLIEGASEALDRLARRLAERLAAAPPAQSAARIRSAPETSITPGLSSTFSALTMPSTTSIA
jgi:hypothetical protein